MKKGNRKKIAGFWMTAVLALTLLPGCLLQKEEAEDLDYTSGNIVITETGEILKEEKATAEPKQDKPKDMEELGEFSELEQAKQKVEQMPDEPDWQQETEEEKELKKDDGQMQIVFLGDSIFDTSRDGTGIPYMTADACDASCFNLAIGGTCAAIDKDDPFELENWTSISLTGMVNALKGQISPHLFDGKAAGHVLTDPDFDVKNTDYFVVEYGMNDFFSAVPLDNPNGYYDVRTYVGALRYAATNLKDCATDATIIFCCPNYAQFFINGAFVGDGHSFNTGYGTLFDYVGKCQYVANETDSYYFDAFLDLGIDSYSAEQYLEDGVHLTLEGRQLYAQKLSELIMSIEEEKNN